MTFKQTLYSLIVAAIVVAVTLFALQNFQDVDVTIPFLGTFHTKVFVLIVFSFIAGFLTAGFLSLLLKIITLPETIKRRKKAQKDEDRPISESFSDSKKENPSKGDV